MAKSSQILVLNAGSSTLKYALYRAVGGVCSTSASASGAIEKIGESEQKVVHKVHNGDSEKYKETAILDQKTALSHAFALLGGRALSEISAVGHRVVHGGEQMTRPLLVDNTVLKAIRDATPLAPLHNPSNLLGIETSMALLPKTIPHVCVFDTAFHSTIPEKAFLYGIPYSYYKNHAVRRYGFHGTSHEYVLEQAAATLKKPVDKMNAITCHLGAGCSISCIKNGQSIDTSMGMTPSEGLLMATRSGDIDVGIVFHLAKQLNMSLEEIEQMLLQESGWYGLCGMKDMRDIEDEFHSGSEVAERAVGVLVHRIRKYLGAYYWNLNGNIDCIVFTGGVGSNWPYLRTACLEGCNKIGIELVERLNSDAVGMNTVQDISSNQSAVKVLVIPTNEELRIAQHTLSTIDDL